MSRNYNVAWSVLRYEACRANMKLIQCNSKFDVVIFGAKLNKRHKIMMVGLLGPADLSIPLSGTHAFYTAVEAYQNNKETLIIHANVAAIMHMLSEQYLLFSKPMHSQHLYMSESDHG